RPRAFLHARGPARHAATWRPSREAGHTIGWYGPGRRVAQRHHRDARLLGEPLPSGSASFFVRGGQQGGDRKRMLPLTTAKELRERRRQLYLKADEIMERARRAARDLTDDEKRQVDELHDEIERLQRDIERIEKQYALDEYFSRSQGVISGLQDGQQRFWPLGDIDDGQELRALGPGESVRRYVGQTRPGLADEYRGLTVGRYLRAMVTGPKNEVEERALGHTGSAGGYTVPDILGAEIIDAM